jgi:hypothetical protein
MRTARATTSEFGGALLRVMVDGAGTTVEVRARDGVAMPVPSIAEARRQAALLA